MRYYYNRIEEEPTLCEKTKKATAFVFSVIGVGIFIYFISVVILCL